MSTLYELTAGFKELSEAEDIPVEQIQDTLDMIEGDFNDKAVNIVKLVKSLDKTMIDPIDDEIKRLQERKKVIINRQESLREYLRYNMVQSGIKKIECPLFNITLRKGLQKVSIDDESKVPDDLINVKTTITADKKEILKRLKAGEEIPGASMINGEETLMIR